MAHNLVLYPTGTHTLELDTVLTSPSNRILLVPQEGTGPTITFTFTSTGSNVALGKIFYILGTSGKTVYVDWGDSTSPSTIGLNGNLQLLSHTYVSANTYTVNMTGDTNYLSVFQLNSQSDLSFSINVTATIPSNITTLSLYDYYYNSSITASFNSMPSSIQSIGLYSNTLANVTGSIENLPSTLTTLSMASSTSSGVTGSIANMASTTNMSYLSLNGQTNITGSVATMLSNMTNLTSLYLINCSGLTGTVSTWPSSLNYLLMNNQSNVAGTLNGFVGTQFRIDLSNTGTFTGSIANLPTGTYSVRLYNIGTSATGSVNSMPASIREIDLSSSGAGFTCSCSGTFPTYLYRLKLQYVPISGDIASLPNLQYLWIQDNASTLSYTSGHTWKSVMNSVKILPASSYGLTSTQVDNILIDLNNSVTTWQVPREINLAGNNSARTSASNSAVTSLQGKGVTVTTN